MLHKNILAISVVTASLLIWCGGGSSSTSETNTTHETPTDNPTIISNLKVAPLVTATRSIKASSDFTISYTIEDEDGLVDSAIHVKGEDGIEIKTKTFTFQNSQKKENVSATFNINEIGKYSVEVEAKGVGSSSNSSKKSDATFEVTSKDEVAPAPPQADTTPPVLSSTDKVFITTVGTPLSLVEVTANDDTDWSVEVSKSGEVDFNAKGNYKVIYTATDKAGNKSSITHTYVVNAPTPTNTAPKATNDTANTAHNTPVTIDVLANDTDADNDTLTITKIENETWWTWEITADNKIEFIPTDGFSWTATIKYTISDGKGGTDTASVSIEVAEEIPAASWLDLPSDLSVEDGSWWANTPQEVINNLKNYINWYQTGTFQVVGISWDQKNQFVIVGDSLVAHITDDVWHDSTNTIKISYTIWTETYEKTISIVVKNVI